VLPSRSAVVVAGVVAAAVVGLSGCTSPGTDAPIGAATGSSGIRASPSAPTTPTPTFPSASATADAGPLTGSNVPPPSAIGQGWTTNTQPPPGSHGQTGTAWLSARDPADVTAALVPLGCSGLKGTPRYPLPDHALQGRYVSDQDGLNAVVLVLDYPDEVVARSFLGAFSRDISSCPAPPTSGPRSPYVRAITVTEATDTRVVDHWSEFGAGAGTSVWHEVVVRQGNRIGLADVEAPPGATPNLTALADVLDRVIKG
jgi:hypothetical protein